MYKIAVIGDRDSIYGFAALGLDIYPVSEPVDSIEAAKKLRELAEGEYAVIYITESLASKLEAEIDRYRADRLPAIIPIPGVSGNTGMGMKMVKKSVEQAVGSDIIFNDKNQR
jgi:V/A-type H+-transporting ATPase subunit F